MIKTNRLIKLRYNFTILTITYSTIYILIFLALLLLSTPYPLLTLLVTGSVAPSCWLFVHLLFKYRKKLENNINARLTKIIKNELQREFESQNIYCVFDLKPIGFNGSNIANLFHFYYSDEKLYETYIVAISKTRKWVRALLPCLYHLTIYPQEDKTLNSDIVV